MSRDELIKVYKKHVQHIDAEKEVSAIMGAADLDGSGYIDFLEFVTATMD